MAVTLKEVAAKAGVSMATASLALNKSKKIKVETAQRIWDVARALDYIPDVRGKALAMHVTRTIGIVVPRIDNLFVAEMIQNVKGTLSAYGYSLLLCCSEGNAHEERKYIKLFRAGQVDGAIFVWWPFLGCKRQSGYVPDMSNHSQVQQLVKSGVPVIYINRSGATGVPMISTDCELAAYEATKYLIELGHEDIACVGERDAKYFGYQRAMRERKIIARELSLMPSNSLDGGYSATAMMIQQAEVMPSALVCHNDEIAIGAIRCLVGSGVRVPDDISVCGIDNIRISEYLNPPLTTVSIGIEKICELAVQRLFNLIDSKDANCEAETTTCSVRIIARESTAKRCR